MKTKPMSHQVASRPTRARGLKRLTLHRVMPKSLVAPHAGAWIETPLKEDYDITLQSRPTRARGLKLLHLSFLSNLVFVAPHAGAWIETL